MTSGFFTVFDPLHDDADAYLLSDALEKKDWILDFHEDEYRGVHGVYDIVTAETGKLRYLACVSTMTNIPLEAK
jgi:hypothetical protein